MNNLIALGGLHFGTLTDKKDLLNILAIGKENGIDLIDTAPYYGNLNSEIILGDLLSKLKFRPQLSTKVGLLQNNDKFGKKITVLDTLNEEKIYKSVNNSLNNLKIDQIDILLLHAYDQNIPIDHIVFILKNWI